MRSIYLDHNATTRPDPLVVEACREALEESWGNPSSGHWHGKKARAVLEGAREEVASLLGARASEILFTSGGTEANHLALVGAFLHPSRKIERVVVSAIEHPSVLESVSSLNSHGVEVVEIGVDRKGRVDPEEVGAAIIGANALVTVMAANNETGVIQPIGEIASISRAKGALFHVDAVQCVGKIKVDVNDWDVDLLSLAGHKFYGPKGVGCLFIREGTAISGVNVGGGQERGLRGGTENVPAIAGLGAAARLSREGQKDWEPRMASLRDEFERTLLDNISDAKVHGDRDHRLPNTSNMSFMGANGEAVMLELDLAGVRVSTGSACHAGSSGLSRVHRAMGLSPEEGEATLRFSLGKDTTAEELETAAGLVIKSVERIRAIAG